MFKKGEEVKIKVEGMSCSHCVDKVTMALKGIDGVKKVSVNLAKKQVTIISNKKIEEKIIKEMIEDLDYIYLGIVKE